MMLIQLYPCHQVPVMLRHYAILACILSVVHGVEVCREDSFAVFTNFTVDGESLNGTVFNGTASNVAFCSKQCTDVGVHDMFSFNADNGVCNCYTWPVNLTHADHAVLLYISGTLLPLSCERLGLPEVSVVNDEGYRIDDSAITTSTQHGDPNCHRRHARNLNGGTSAQAWCNENNNNPSSQWLQYDFGVNRYLTEVKTRARPSYSQWITSYQIKIWQQNQWITVSNANNDPITYPGNTDTGTIVTHGLPIGISGSKIRIVPFSYHEHISTRFDVMGC